MMKQFDLEEMLEKIPPGELAEFITQQFHINRDFYYSFTEKFSNFFSNKTKDEYYEQIVSELSSIADQYYIDEEASFSFSKVVFKYESNINKLIKSKNYDEAFKILTVLLEAISKFSIDDSYGIVGDEFEQYSDNMEEILKNSNQEITWFDYYFNLDDDFIDYKSKMIECCDKYVLKDKMN